MSSPTLLPVFERLGCLLPPLGTVNESFGQLVEWATEEGRLVEALDQVAWHASAMYANLPVSAEELDFIELILEQWDRISHTMPPHAPAAWNESANTTDHFELESMHASLRRYFGFARDRIRELNGIGSQRRRRRRPSTRAAFGGVHIAEENIVVHDEQLIDQYLVLINRSATAMAGDRRRTRRRQELLARLLQLEIKHLRQASYIRTAIRGTPHSPAADDTWFLLNELLPLMRIENLSVMGEAISYLNEELLQPILRLQQAGHDDAVLCGRDIDAVKSGIVQECRIWKRLDNGWRLFGAQSAQEWVWGDFGRRLSDAQVTDALASAKFFAENGLLQPATALSPLTTLIMLTAMSDVGYGRTNRTSQWYDEIPVACWEIIGSLFSVSGAPGRLLFFYRYWSIVRTELLLRPPTELLLEHYFNGGDARRGLTELACWWAAITPRVVPTRHGEEFEKWRRELAQSATGAMQTGQSDEMAASPWEAAKATVATLKASGLGLTLNFLVNPHELRLSVLKQEQLRFFRYDYSVPHEIFEIASSRIAELAASADAHHVDLVFLISYNDSLAVLHRPAGRSSWQGFRFGAFPRHILLGAGRYASHRLFGKFDQGADGISSSLLRAGLDTDAVAQHFGLDIGSSIVDHVPLGSNVALIACPELGPFPIVAGIIAALKAVGRTSAIGEFDGTALWDVSPLRTDTTVVSHYSAFVLDGLPDQEVAWSDLGLPGDLASDFTGPEILDAASRPGRVVHVVSHGLLDGYDPLFSMLATGGDHHLMLLDLVGTELRSPLLFLNGCSTAAAGAYGSQFGQSFILRSLNAGVGAAIGNVLPIDSGVATLFSRAFQRDLGEAGRSLAAAFSSAAASVDDRPASLVPVTLVGRSLTQLFGPVTLAPAAT